MMSAVLACLINKTVIKGIVSKQGETEVFVFKYDENKTLRSLKKKVTDYQTN